MIAPPSPTVPVTRVGAAATRRVAGLLAAPPRAAVVVHAGAEAAYLTLDDGRCLGLLATAARALPCGLRTTLPRLDLTAGQEAVVGDGALRAGSYDVRVGRLVDASVPVAADAPDVTAVLADPAVRAVRAELPTDALASLAIGSPEPVAALLGRGSGLTPVGDDVLCGFLAGARASGRPGDAATVAAEVDRLAPRRTSALSAELLACAAWGEVLPEFAALVRSLDRPSAALARLVAVGHTSGAGLALGLALAVPAPAAGRTTS